MLSKGTQSWILGGTLLCCVFTKRATVWRNEPKQKNKSQRTQNKVDSPTLAKLTFWKSELIFVTQSTVKQFESDWVKKRCTTAFWMDVSSCAMSTPPLDRALRHKSRRRRFRQFLIRSVRFALLNSEAGAAATPPSRVDTRSQQMQLTTTTTTTTKTSKNEYAVNHENQSSFPSASVLT